MLQAAPVKSQSKKPRKLDKIVTTSRKLKARNPSLATDYGRVDFGKNNKSFIQTPREQPLSYLEDCSFFESTKPAISDHMLLPRCSLPIS